MNTLRELGEFVGIPQDSGEYGAPIPPIGLRLVSKLLAPVSTAEQRASMRAMISLIPTLPPVGLEAQLLSPGSGKEPYVVDIRVSSTTALVISTRVCPILSGQEFPGSQNYGSKEGSYSTTLAPGQWDLLVKRAGISAAGYTKLSKSFRVTVVRDEPLPPQSRPHIKVDHEGPANATRFVVTGSGFLLNQAAEGQYAITVRIVNRPNVQDWLMIRTGSDADGKIHLETDALDMGSLPRNAADQAILNFSATDKRKDPNSTPANEPLWSNTTTFTWTPSNGFNA